MQWPSLRANVRSAGDNRVSGSLGTKGCNGIVFVKTRLSAVMRSRTEWVVLGCVPLPLTTVFGRGISCGKGLRVRVFPFTLKRIQETDDRYIFGTKSVKQHKGF